MNQPRKDGCLQYGPTPCSGGHRGPFEDREWADGTIDLVCISCGEVAKEGHAFRTAEGLTVEVCRQNVDLNLFRKFIDFLK